MPTRRLPLDGPLDLRATLGPMRTGRWDPTWRIERDEAWWATFTPAGPAALHLRRLGDHLRGEAWGPGRDWVLGRLAELVGPSPVRCGSADPLAGAEHPLVRQAARAHPGLRMGATGTVTSTAVATVLGQRVTAGEATRSWAELVRAHGGIAPGPAGRLGLRVPPDPARLAALGYAAFHPFGVERGRAETIMGLCRRAGRLEALVDRRVDDAVRVLARFPGVGPWTTAIVATVALGHPDAPVVGDYHIPHHVGFALEGTPRSSDERMLELLAPYAGHRGRAQRLVLRSSSRPGRRTPRQRVLPMSRM